MKLSKNASLYVAAVLKPQSEVAYFGITASKKHARKPLENSGTFRSKGRTETQLKAMIHGIYLAEGAETLTVYTESSVFDQFTNGTVGTWELADWCKGNGKPIEHADLWEELSRLVETRNINFEKPKSKKEMTQVQQLVASEKNKSEEFMNLYLGELTVKYATETENSELMQVELELFQGIEKKDENSNKEKKTTSKTHNTTETKAKPQQVSSASIQAKQLEFSEVGTKSLNVEFDAETLKSYDDFFQELGLDTKTAVKIFLKQAYRSKSIPFDLTLK